jgi:hypothetical protein
LTVDDFIYLKATFLPLRPGVLSIPTAMPKGLFYKRALAVLIGLASLYVVAVVLVMTPFIQTQFRDIQAYFTLINLRLPFTVLAFFTPTT